MIVLGIDQAALSGWCIVDRESRSRYSVVAHGTCTKAVERRDIVARAIDVACGAPIVAVYERHGVGGGERWNPEAMIGVGDSRGRWLEALELAGISRNRCIAVEVYSWRRAMIGAGRRDRAAWKAAAVQSCRARGVVVTSDDEAEAILIALWGAGASAEVEGIAAKAARAKR